jgi:hypothetical protein
LPAPSAPREQCQTMIRIGLASQNHSGRTSAVKR